MIIKGYVCLFLHKNIYCWYSLESSRRGDSIEYSQHIPGMFLWRTGKIILQLSPNTLLICSSLWNSIFRYIECCLLFGYKLLKRRAFYHCMLLY